MSRKIWKYTLAELGRQYLQMPAGAQILTVQLQDDMVQLWAIVDPNAEKVERVIDIYGTGHQMPDVGPGEYLGTFQMHGGALVFHVFEALPT